MFKLHKAGSLERLTIFLNGGIIGSKKIHGSISGLVGNDLTFSKPAATVTFPDPNGDGLLSPAQIAAAIKTQLSSNVVIQFFDGHMAITETTPTTGVVLDSTAEASKTILGLVVDQAGVVYGAAGSAAVPRLDSIYEVMGTFAALTWE
jgi:hypothetical protein